MDLTKLIDKVKNIIVTPKEEWEVIATAVTERRNLFINYALPLIVVAAIGKFIGASSYGLGHSVYSGFMTAIAYIISTLGGLYIAAVVINELAETFHTQRDFDAILKLVVYAATPAYLATFVASLHPMLSFTGLFGLYSLYLFWLGVDPLLKTPKEKKVGYVTVSLLITVAAIFLLQTILISILVASSAMQFL